MLRLLLAIATTIVLSACDDRDDRSTAEKYLDIEPKDSLVQECEQKIGFPASVERDFVALLDRRLSQIERRGPWLVLPGNFEGYSGMASMFASRWHFVQPSQIHLQCGGDRLFDALVSVSFANITLKSNDFSVRHVDIIGGLHDDLEPDIPDCIDQTETIRFERLLCERTADTFADLFESKE